MEDENERKDDRQPHLRSWSIKVLWFSSEKVNEAGEEMPVGENV